MISTKAFKCYAYRKLYRYICSFWKTKQQENLLKKALWLWKTKINIILLGVLCILQQLFLVAKWADGRDFFHDRVRRRNRFKVAHILFSSACTLRYASQIIYKSSGARAKKASVGWSDRRLAATKIPPPQPFVLCTKRPCSFALAHWIVFVSAAGRL